MLYAQPEVFSSQRDKKETTLYQQKHRSVYTETADKISAVSVCEKRILASSCLSVCLSAWKTSALIGRLFVKFDIQVFFEKLSRK
jgi:hypothetical protein